MQNFSRQEFFLNPLRKVLIVPRVAQRDAKGKRIGLTGSFNPHAFWLAQGGIFSASSTYDGNEESS